MHNPIHSEFEIADMSVLYCNIHNTVSLVIVPKDKRDQVNVQDMCFNDPMIQLSVLGDKRFRCYSRGQSMRNSESVHLLEITSQQMIKNENRTDIVTVFKRNDGQECEHHLIWNGTYPVLESYNIYKNNSECDIMIEMLSSFSISGITPFPANGSRHNLFLHRIRSRWSAEGHLETKRIEELQLEQAWANYGIRVERFGQVGSMPVRGGFPFAALEDADNGVIWAVSLQAKSSWQLEIERYNDKLSMTGGLADFEFGHWRKKLSPGGSFKTPRAFLTAVSGSIDDACNRLVNFYGSNTPDKPAEEQDLPIVFNEYCTTWGVPTTEKIRNMTKVLKGKGVQYFVIDAGWYCGKPKDWDRTLGDWIPSKKLFPNGIQEAVKIIKDAGMLPGIWFEFEGAADLAEIYSNDRFLLTRDNRVIRNEGRVFLDLRKPEVKQYLNEKVIRFIKENGFRYIKVDYNDTLGIGCDGAESFGEGLRQYSDAVYDFYQSIKSEIPDIIIEICAAGGHRLEPEYLSIGNMSSFSDAHECHEGAIIAANLHRVIPPRQSQIWAVLHKKDMEKEMIYTLSKSFLGRMCLSGEICDLYEKQWEIVKSSIGFYNKIKHIIKDGNSFRYGPDVLSFRHPEGWQAILRFDLSCHSALLIFHSFGGTLPETVCIQHEKLSGLQVMDQFAESGLIAIIHEDSISFPVNGNFSAFAVYLKKA